MRWTWYVVQRQVLGMTQCGTEDTWSTWRVCGRLLSPPLSVPPLLCRENICSSATHSLLNVQRQPNTVVSLKQTLQSQLHYETLNMVKCYGLNWENYGILRVPHTVLQNCIFMHKHFSSLYFLLSYSTKSHITDLKNNNTYTYVSHIIQSISIHVYINIYLYMSI